MSNYDVCIIGAGIMGSTTALFQARSGKKVLLVDKLEIFRSASGVNAGTLTMHMTRAQLIPYSLKGWEMWMTTEKWLSKNIEVKQQQGLCLAFNDAEEQLLIERSKKRKEMGAPIEILSAAEALKKESSITQKIKCAAYCELDGYVQANQTGRAYKEALDQSGVEIQEHSEVVEIKNDKFFEISLLKHNEKKVIKSKKLIIAAGVWTGHLLKMLNITIELKCLPQQLIITERHSKILNSVITVANGKLSLKQFENGTTLIGGGWPGKGNVDENYSSTTPENLIGNLRLACYAIPELKKNRAARVWLGLEAETTDAMPIIGQVPNIQGLYVIASVHSGYTSGPYMGYLLSKFINEEDVDLNLFNIERLLPEYA
jgi:sarcosine oxidase, subunit beta